MYSEFYEILAKSVEIAQQNISSGELEFGFED